MQMRPSTKFQAFVWTGHVLGSPDGIRWAWSKVGPCGSGGGLCCNQDVL